jgi:ferritin
MQITDRLFSAFNSQYSAETTNYLVYANLQNQADANAWDGFSAFFAKSSKEELEHAEGFRSFIIDCNRTPQLVSISIPPAQGQKPLEWITLALEAERANTKRILDLVTL